MPTVTALALRFLTQRKPHLVWASALLLKLIVLRLLKPRTPDSWLLKTSLKQKGGGGIDVGIMHRVVLPHPQ